jgi:hypothetical protein
MPDLAISSERPTEGKGGQWVACWHCGRVSRIAETVPDPDGHPHGADKCAKCGEDGQMTSLFGRAQLRWWTEGKRLDDWNRLMDDA